ncbi:unnamed protein product [Cuscuta epithymum]|uniref:Uncharacterized protein n=1 Tax=Cuscuta epithymum TaxID=186058 RepID=A0AAV0CXS4_9ASTE|nr:unnamed protein product [Cuscuta epithymum]CAH9146757.1 unnamed protein product [Cuscuta epithymum]
MENNLFWFLLKLNKSFIFVFEILNLKQLELCLLTPKCSITVYLFCIFSGLQFKYDTDQECKPTQPFMSLEQDQQIRSILTKQRPERLRATNSFSDRAQHSLNANKEKFTFVKLLFQLL